MALVQPSNPRNNVGRVPFYGMEYERSRLFQSPTDHFSKQESSALAEHLSNEYRKINDLEDRIKDLAKKDGIPEELFKEELTFLQNARQIIASFTEQFQTVMNQIIRNIG